MASKTKSPSEVVLSWIDAVNSHDIPRIMETLHDEYEYWFNDQLLKGMQEVKTAWETYLKAIPDLHLEPLLVISDGVYVGVRFRVTGTNNGPVKSLQSGSSIIPVPHAAKTIDYTEGEFFRIKDGKIINLWNYWDTAALQKQ